MNDVIEKKNIKIAFIDIFGVLGVSCFCVLCHILKKRSMNLEIVGLHSGFMIADVDMKASDSFIQNKLYIATIVGSNCTNHRIESLFKQVDGVLYFISARDPAIEASKRRLLSMIEKYKGILPKIIILLKRDNTMDKSYFRKIYDTFNGYALDFFEFGPPDWSDIIVPFEYMFQVIQSIPKVDLVNEDL